MYLSYRRSRLKHLLSGIAILSAGFPGASGSSIKGWPDHGVVVRAADPVITASDLSVPIYPGARQAAGAMKVKNANGFAVSATFVTRDDRSRVVMFYRAKFAGRIAILPGPVTTTMVISNSSVDKLMITVLGSTIGTRITYMHTIKPSAK